MAYELTRERNGSRRATAHSTELCEGSQSGIGLVVSCVAVCLLCMLVSLIGWWIYCRPITEMADLQSSAGFVSSVQERDRQSRGGSSQQLLFKLRDDSRTYHYLSHQPRYSDVKSAVAVGEEVQVLFKSNRRFAIVHQIEHDGNLVVSLLDAQADQRDANQSGLYVGLTFLVGLPALVLAEPVIRWLFRRSASA